MKKKLLSTAAPPATLIIRALAVGVFLLEGIKKFLFVEQWGTGRFSRIGIPSPHVLAPFVGVVEILGGVLLLTGLLTRLASIALIIDISVAIMSTKIPILLKSVFGRWKPRREPTTRCYWRC